MDCCTSSEFKQGGKMDKKTFWIAAGIIIAVLLILVIWQTVKISEISSATSAAQTIATGVQSAATSASNGMVGGC